MKFCAPSTLSDVILSLPSRERGLKFSAEKVSHHSTQSLPSRERGLKSLRFVIVTPIASVAPFAGAWIEMSYFLYFRNTQLRRSLRGSVD